MKEHAAALMRPAQPVPAQQQVPAQQLRSTLARHATGVVIVTGPGPVGLTVTTFNSASLDPPLVSFYVARSSTTWPRLHAARVFAGNVLAVGQADIADRFARRDGDRFGPNTQWQSGPLGVPLITGAACHVSCELDTAVPVAGAYIISAVGITNGATPIAAIVTISFMVIKR